MSLFVCRANRLCMLPCLVFLLFVSDWQADLVQVLWKPKKELHLCRCFFAMLRNQETKKKWASETKMCSFAWLLVSPHGTLLSAVCWLSVFPVFLQWQTSGPFCLSWGGQITGSCSNAKNGTFRQPFHRGRGVLTLQLHVSHFRTERVWKPYCLFFAAQWPSCKLQKCFWIFPISRQLGSFTFWS